MSAFSVTLLQGPTELAGMRHALTSWLERTDASEDVRGAILLATHEAAANALVHGESDSPVTVAASQDDDGGFTIEVTNRGGWKHPEPGHPGRGLGLMTTLMSEVAIQTSVRMRSG
jgi:anti-sigma regulatory factor (Ser/Thr protein kinase)